MKTLRKSLLCLSLLGLFSITPTQAQYWKVQGQNNSGYNINQNQHQVQGYYRSNGTYVKPYTRTNPNSVKWDNIRYFILPELY